MMAIITITITIINITTCYVVQLRLFITPHHAMTSGFLYSRELFSLQIQLPVSRN
jgi:hypothetical protein